MATKKKKVKVNKAVISARRRWKFDMSKAWKDAETQSHHTAREALHRAMNRAYDRKSSLDASVLYATTSLVRAVADSMNVRVPINVRNGHRTEAATDFKTIQIVVKCPPLNLDDMTAVSRRIHFIKGLVYHEIGHIKYTVPLYHLLNDLGKDYNDACNDYYARCPDALHDSWMIKKAWNSLEDQRMECAMVRYSPSMGAYFTTIVLDYVAAHNAPMAWPLVAGRTYLDKGVLDMFRKAAATFCTDPTLIRDTSTVVSRYKRAKTPQEMYDCVIDYCLILRRWGVVGDEHGIGVPEPTGKHNDPPWDNPHDRQKYDDSSQPEDGSSDKNVVTSVRDDDDAGQDDAPVGVRTNEDSGKVDLPDDEDIKRGQGRGTSHSDEYRPPTNPPSDKDIHDSVQKALEDAYTTAPATDHETKEFLSVVNHENNQDMPHNGEVMFLKDEDMQKVDTIYNGMMSTLEMLAVQASPSWRFRQEDGVLDPTAFNLREPGDSDYWSNLNDNGGIGFDLSVSVIMDVSYSMMENWCRDNGIAALAIRRACDELNIPCTTSTFSDSGRRLWNHDEEPNAVFPYATGGTWPVTCLEALPDERLGKSRHLVIIFTDGQWSEVNNLAPYSAPGRFFLLVGLGFHLKQYLSTLNANAVVTVATPLDIPEHVTQALAGFLA